VWLPNCAATIWSGRSRRRVVSLKKSFEAADKMGARYILIVGENEVAADAFALKHLASGEQVTVPRTDLVQRILRK
jgi:histidyl-tRNA synthetase